MSSCHPITRFATRFSGTAQAGFSLPEMMVATALLATAIAALGQLAAIATASNRGARATTYAAVLAFQKMEQLRGLAYAEATPSPAGTLGANRSGYVEYLDGYGRSLGGGDDPPHGTVYVQRWSIDPLPANVGGALVLQVLVTSVSGRAPVRLVGVRARKTP